ncbi:MAG: DUF58 domain-containing protein [Fuerstiella sp.]
MSLFGTDFLTRLEYLSLVSRKVFRGQLMAQRRTMQTGSGIEFADHRQYNSGDDFRYLDWNLYARHDELLLKRFQEEEDLHVYFLLDCSRSMSTGDPPKFDVARRVTAALAYVALADLDRVSVLASGDAGISQFPLTRGKSRILSLMQFLENLSPDGRTTRLTELSREFVLRAPRRGLVVMLSDFFDTAGYQQSLDVLRHHKFEPHVVQLYDQSEADPALLGDVELQDVESGDVRSVTVREQQLDEYRRIFQNFLNDIRAYCARYGIGCTITDTTTSFDQLVLSMLRAAGSPL